MQPKPSIVFFGSGPVALSSLLLLKDHFALEAIVTKPATAQEMQASFPDVTVYTADSKLSLDNLCSYQQFKSQVAILIDFGIIVSQGVITSFPLGIINSHFSLLPEWRGADPITFAILSGQERTGVSLMLLVPAMDEGPLLSQQPCDITANDTTTTLTNRLVGISAQLLTEVVPQYIDHRIVPHPQSSTATATYSRKLTKEDGRIDWTKPAQQIEREVRAFAVWPKSYTTLAGRETVILEVQVHNSQGTPGTIDATKKQLIVHCGEGSLEILRLKPAGKPAMSAAAFLAGYRQML